MSCTPEASLDWPGVSEGVPGEEADQPQCGMARSAVRIGEPMGKLLSSMLSINVSVSLMPSWLQIELFLSPVPL